MIAGRVVVSSAEDLAANAGDDFASRESASLTQRKTREKLRQEAEDGRTEIFRKHFEGIALVGMYITAVGFGLSALIWGWHILTPVALHWLDEGSIGTIQAILTGGVLASVASGHFKKRME